MAGLDEIPPDKLEDLRVALATMLREGVDLAVRRLRERAGAKTSHAGAVLAAYRAGRFAVDLPKPPAVAAPVAPPAPVVAAGDVAGDDSPPPTPADLARLVEAVRRAKPEARHEATLVATTEIMRAHLLGVVNEKTARLIKEGMGEARQAIKGAAAEVVSVVEDVRPCTLEGAELVVDFEGIASDERRAGIRAFVRRELEADQISGPSALGQLAAGEGA